LLDRAAQHHQVDNLAHLLGRIEVRQLAEAAGKLVALREDLIGLLGLGLQRLGLREFLFGLAQPLGHLGSVRSL